MDCIPAVLSKHAALLIGMDVYLPGPRALSGGVLELEDAEEPIRLFFSHRLPFPTAGLAFGHLQPTHPFTGEEQLAAARYVVLDTIRQWRRSQEEGVEYEHASKRPTCIELSEDGLEWIIAPPRLFWFGWTWSLEPADNGSVIIEGRRFRPVSPIRTEEWWSNTRDRCRQLVLTRGSRSAEFDGLDDEDVITIPDLTTTVRVTLHSDDRLEVCWNGPDRQFEFAMRFASFALGSEDRRVYVFPSGRFTIMANVEELAHLMTEPEVRRLRNRVDMGNDILHSCVGTDNRVLCTGGGLDRVHGSGLSPAGIILRSLELGVRVLLTGLGPGGPIVHRALSATGAPSMSVAEARRRGIEFVPWRHSERGMTEVYEL